jgi:hypothetical protein
MVLRGLLGFLDDLRTRVKPTRGVLDLPSETSSGQEGDTEDKQKIITEREQARQGTHASPRERPARPRRAALACPRLPAAPIVGAADRISMQDDEKYRHLK